MVSCFKPSVHKLWHDWHVPLPVILMYIHSVQREIHWKLYWQCMLMDRHWYGSSWHWHWHVQSDLEISISKFCWVDSLTWVFPKIMVPPKSLILIGFSIINHPFWGIPIFGNTHILLPPTDSLKSLGIDFSIKKSRELHLQQALARHLGGGGLSEHKPSSFLSKIFWLLSRDFKSDFTNMKGDIFWESS